MIGAWAMVIVISSGWPVWIAEYAQVQISTRGVDESIDGQLE